MLLLLLLLPSIVSSTNIILYSNISDKALIKDILLELSVAGDTRLLPAPSCPSLLDGVALDVVVVLLPDISSKVADCPWLPSSLDFLLIHLDSSNQIASKSFKGKTTNISLISRDVEFLTEVRREVHELVEGAERLRGLSRGKERKGGSSGCFRLPMGVALGVGFILAGTVAVALCFFFRMRFYRRLLQEKAPLHRPTVGGFEESEAVTALSPSSSTPPSSPPMEGGGMWEGLASPVHVPPTPLNVSTHAFGLD